MEAKTKEAWAITYGASDILYSTVRRTRREAISDFENDNPRKDWSTLQRAGYRVVKVVIQWEGK